MNQIALNEGSKFEKDKDSNICHLKQIPELKMLFYKNGILIEDYAFYYYSSEEALDIMDDIKDGYCPYIFKDKYPNCLSIKVIKKLEDTFNEKEYEQNNSKDLNHINFKKKRNYQQKVSLI